MLYKYVYINIYNVMAGLLLYYNHATIMQRHRNLHKNAMRPHKYHFRENPRLFRENPFIIHKNLRNFAT